MTTVKFEIAQLYLLRASCVVIGSDLLMELAVILHTLDVLLPKNEFARL